MGSFNKNILVSLFRRRGAVTGITVIFDSLNEFDKARVSNLVTLNDAEEIVVVSIPASNHWLFITTERVLYRHQEKLLTINHKELINVDLSLASDYNKGATDKRHLSHIALNTSNNNYVIEVEAGLAFWGLMNVLTHIAGKNAKATNPAHES